MNSADLIDISHHNTITNWDMVPDVPIVHKVNEGRAVDKQFHNRIPIIEDRTAIFGGYTVLIVSQSTIREQVERYADEIGMWWRTGAFTQLDVEPWPERYPRPVNAEEILEAAEVHDQLFGPNRVMLYINPRQMPGVLEEVRRHRDIPLWEPHYGSLGHNVALRNRATIHQWTSKYPMPGFASGIDVNTIMQRDILDATCGLTTHPKENDMVTKTLWSAAGSESVYCLEDGPIHISPALRQAWRDDPNVHVIEVYGDNHKETRESIEWAALPHPVEVEVPPVSYPNGIITWETP